MRRTLTRPGRLRAPGADILGPRVPWASWQIEAPALSYLGPPHQLLAITTQFRTNVSYGFASVSYAP